MESQRVEPNRSQLTNGATTRPIVLISVRNLREWRIAVDGGVEIVDLKEPRRGPLAATKIELWNRVATEMQRQSVTASLSVALGESNTAIDLAPHVPPVTRFAKMGPSGCDSDRRLIELWQRVQSKLPTTTELVAVGYADYRLAGTIRPMQILDTAASAGLSRVLIDTFVKNNTTSWRTIRQQWPALQRQARRNGQWLALAGSLSMDDVRQFARQPRSLPDCLGFRGAVCDGSRTAAVSVDRVTKLIKAIHSIGPVDPAALIDSAGLAHRRTMPQ